MQIKKMSERDCGAVWELQKKCFSVPWSLESIREMFETEGYLNLTAWEDGVLAGYIGIKAVLDEADITNVAVHPDRSETAIWKLFPNFVRLLSKMAWLQLPTLPESTTQLQLLLL